MTSTRMTNKERNALRETGFNVCNTCGETKELLNFTGRRNECKLCAKEYLRGWKKKNPSYAANWLKSYRANNPDYVAYVDKYVAEWSKKYPEKVAAKGAKYRGRKLGAVPDSLADCPVEKQAIIDIYKECQELTKTTGTPHHVDHMWPLFDGGPHWSVNLQILTGSENCSKGAKVDPDIKAKIQQLLEELNK